MNNQTLLKQAFGNISETIQRTFGELKDDATDAVKGDRGIRDSVGDFMRGDGHGMDWRWGIGGTALMDNVLGGASSMYAKRLKSDGGPLKGDDVGLDQKLREYAKKMKVGVKDSPLESPFPSGSKMKDWMEKVKMKASNSAHYNRMTNTVNLPSNMKDPGVLAHELGHSQQGRKTFYANPIGRLLTMMGTGGAAFTHDKNEAWNQALLGTAGGVATLGNELHASHLGSKLLRGAGAKGMGAMRSFKGVPTYAALAASPMAMYGAKNYFGGFDGQ